MLKSPYDTDSITWSPQGRLYQVEYAMEAIKQGSLCVGLRSSTHAILATLNRSVNPLAEHQQKTYRIDDKIGLCFAGLTADGRLITKFLRNEALNYKYAYTQPIKPLRLVNKLAEKAQIKTQRYGKRPYGVGCLISGVDELGPHIFEINPDANFNEYYSVAIGVRNQAAKTYLEKHFESFPGLSRQELIQHAANAVKTSAQNEQELNGKSVTISIVGVDEDFTFLPGEEIEAVLGPAAGDRMEVDA